MAVETLLECFNREVNKSFQAMSPIPVFARKEGSFKGFYDLRFAAHVSRVGHILREQGQSASHSVLRFDKCLEPGFYLGVGIDPGVVLVCLDNNPRLAC